MKTANGGTRRVLVLDGQGGGIGAQLVRPAAEPPPAETPQTFTDDLGREISLDPPKRVAAMIGSFADIWCLAGGKAP